MVKRENGIKCATLYVPKAIFIFEIVIKANVWIIFFQSCLTRRKMAKLIDIDGSCDF